MSRTTKYLFCMNILIALAVMWIIPDIIAQPVSAQETPVAYAQAQTPARTVEKKSPPPMKLNAAQTEAANPDATAVNPGATDNPITVEPGPDDDAIYAIYYPYSDFVVTQGPHGAEYGQMAIDIAAGKGAVQKSPITGTVTALYVDEYGNPVLILDNARYTVMLYHSQFSVKVGDPVIAGKTPVGLESNQGYTVDMFGQLCTGRDCGYHTHINVYDKQKGKNVNPLKIMEHPV